MDIWLWITIGGALFIIIMLIKMRKKNTSTGYSHQPLVSQDSFLGRCCKKMFGKAWSAA